MLPTSLRLYERDVYLYAFVRLTANALACARIELIKRESILDAERYRRNLVLRYLTDEVTTMTDDEYDHLIWLYDETDAEISVIIDTLRFSARLAYYERVLMQLGRQLCYFIPGDVLRIIHRHIIMASE